MRFSLTIQSLFFIAISMFAVTSVSAQVPGEPHASELAMIRPLVKRDLHPQLRIALETMAAAFESRWEDVIRHIGALIDSGFSDPEGLFHWAGGLAMAGDQDGALEVLERTVESGFYPASAFVSYPNLDPLRSNPDFRHIVRRAEERHREAVEAFRAADGPHLLGLPNR